MKQLQQQRTYSIAAASAERFAEIVSFQWHYASFPPHEIFKFAKLAELPAVHSAEVLQFMQILQQ